MEDERKLEMLDHHCLGIVLRVKYTDFASKGTVYTRCDNIARMTQAIQEGRLRRFGHVLRRPPQELNVTALDPSPLSYWRRRKGDQLKTWLDAVVQYVGEICRYLLHQPYRKEEKEHKVRLATGNGLRKEVWVDFVKRFGVEQVVEFYGATESNANLCNCENKVGAIGFSSMIIPAAYPVYLVKTDLETGEVLRDPKTGLCQLCSPGEVGQMVGYVKHNSPIRNFEGYINRKESSRKVLRNVKKQGDAYFLSGDLLVQDEEGYFYFVDRLGDTFRWRGENVSTTEVENIVSKVINFADCAVYGVEVPHNEGRAGMLSLVYNAGSRKRNNSINEEEKEDGAATAAKVNQSEQLARETEALNDLAVTFAAQLPVYARPLFVRFSEAIDTTDTFKFRKIAMVREGFDPRNKTDHIYYLNTKANVYQRLDETIYNQIMENRIRF
ncbi:hypothetical protein SprV_0301029400 [Sparganum proliferum]